MEKVAPVRLSGRERWLLGFILGIGCFLRLYHLPNTLLFLGDQGRDALIARAILKDHDLTLIGPVTSVGNMYLGPFYYYFMVPFLALTYPNPVGPAYGVALVNCASVVFLFWATRQLFSKRTAFLATVFYALMPLAITFSRFSWNPNLGAPLGILTYWLLVRWYQTRSTKHAVGVGLMLGILVQLHYVALTTVATAMVIWFWGLVLKKSPPQLLIAQALLVLGIIGLCLSPLAVFDYRHEHLLSKQFQAFFTSSEQHILPAQRFLTVIRDMEGRAYRILSQVVSGTKNVPIDRILAYAGIFIIGWFVVTNKKVRVQAKPLTVLLVWLGLAIMGTAFYSSSIFDHYLTYCYPLIALFWALIVDLLWQSRIPGKIGAMIIGGYLSFVLTQGICRLPFNGDGTARYQAAVNEALPLIETPYNIALLGANGDFQGMNYRYFFTTSEKQPQKNESYTNLKTLVVIDEIGIGNPLSVPAYEIQTPHLSTLAAQLAVPNGPRIYVFK